MVIPALVVVQIVLIGVGAFHGATLVDDKFGDKQVPPCDPSCGKAFNDSFENWFEPHVVFGYVLLLVVVLYALFSLATRDRRLIKIGGITVALFIVQVLLAYVGYGVSALGWLHPLNALLILGYTSRNALVARREQTGAQAPAVTAPAA
jgi:hypothetical protein